MPTSYIAFIQLSADLMGLYILTILGLAFITCVVWLAHEAKQAKRQAILEAEEAEFLARKHVRFDAERCVLTRGSLRLEVPYDTLEYFVCKVVFEEPTQYHSDSDIIDYANLSININERPIYQACRRINAKAKATLELEDELLVRVKEKTTLNEKYI